MRTIKFNNVYINESFTLSGSDIKSPSILRNVDYSFNDFYLKEKSCELGESNYLSICLDGLLKKTNNKITDVDLLISSDLQNQLLASNFMAKKYDVSFMGVYNACASFNESIIIASSFIENNLLKNIVCLVSANNLVSEKQFRFPIEYGACRKKVNSFTYSGACGVLMSNKKSKYKINNATIGNVVDLGHADCNDMGAAMAPSCAEVLYHHLNKLDLEYSNYDIILTGDLGIYGVDLVKEYLIKKYKLKIDNIFDAGVILYNIDYCSDFAGGSGPACGASVLFSKILKERGIKKVLFISTGSLHSSTSSNLRLSMPSIAHAIEIEVAK